MMPRKNHNWILKEGRFTEEERYEIQQAMSQRIDFLYKLAMRSENDKELQDALYEDWNRCKLASLKMEWEEILRGRPRKRPLDD
jgi:hypothetical protein